MNRLAFIIIATVMAGFSAGAASAADAAAGQAKAQMCVACHGADGNSTNAGFPSLAGQVPGYIAGQLGAFKSGKRVNPVMQGMAQLSPTDMADIDAWYASQVITPRSIDEDQLALAREGETLYRAGTAELAIPACMACHGPAGRGMPSSYPRVAGQWPEYLESQLLAFKSGDRVGKIMGPIAHRLSTQQIHALSLYMSALQ
ncbi:MAG: cytochrome c4 [Acidiferrobacteraceae bacterium]|jgi:cytochrome c553|nr:cytochrome c4 [Acidiferrobacteraceae bacterium]MDP6950693.1 c-type cytochrome [Arenicellales bacterium]|tara:strand:+ start:3545 stop:4147 length:603 start_codon:yes stop_codon:yes gene_type:complete